MSNLSSATLRRFFRESFVGTEPLKVKPADFAELVDRVKQRLQAFDCVDLSGGRHVSGDQKSNQVVSFSLRPPGGDHYYYHSNSFQLVRSPAGGLQIDDYYRLKANVSSLDELVAFVQMCRDRFQRRNVQDAKRTKVRGLKSHAILAQLKVMAKEDKFDFFLDERHQTLDVLVRLEDSVAIEIKLSYKDFQHQLPELRAAINDLRRLYERGIKFKVIGLSRYYDKKWILHENL